MNTLHPVALTGFMTAGKSSVGPQLAMRMGLDFVDLDDRIMQDAAASIREIFATEGEAGFRARESAQLVRALDGAPCVLATGGGIVGATTNREILARDFTVVWLDLRFETVLERLREEVDAERPLVEHLGTDGLRALHRQRRPLYASCARMRVDADRDVPGRLARRIALFLHQTGTG